MKGKLIMSLYQQHRQQMIESSVRRYLPAAHGAYRQEHMMDNLRILAAQSQKPQSRNHQICPSKNS